MTKEVPESLLYLLKIQSLGPKKIASLYKNLGITTIKDLRTACQQGKLRDLAGFGVITELNLLRGIALLEKTSGRALLPVAFSDGNKVINYLKNCGKIDILSIGRQVCQRVPRRRYLVGISTIIVSRSPVLSF